MVKFVCPQPIPWNAIYEKLLAAWEASGREGPKPPVPLILAGWIYSSDLDKHRRWRDTLAWAEQRGPAHLVPPLREEEQYCVAELSSYAGPGYSGWSFEPKVRPSLGEVDGALRTLRELWPTIAGADLAAATKPKRLAGRKWRRLVVSADPRYRPPWGSWGSFESWGDRQSFTRLRRAVNEAIRPLEVDHIDFEAVELKAKDDSGLSRG